MLGSTVSYVENFDSRVLCPTTAEVCPAKQLLISLYEQPANAAVEATMVGECNPALNGIKLRAKLGEYAARQDVHPCTGVNAGVCPTRSEMDQSTSRSLVVSGFRKLKKGLRS